MNLKQMSPPACNICGDTTSTGLHCGTITCEACKKFFLRTAKKEDRDLDCKRSGNCVITFNSRTKCSFCRYKKCKEAGMRLDAEKKQSSRPKQDLCLSCQICNSKATGVHFGTLTCEGCKGFFRRTDKAIKERGIEKLECINRDNKCIISAQTRTTCKSCRYNRCLELKMDTGSSKIGRQSNLFKENLKQQSVENLETRPRSTSTPIYQQSVDNSATTAYLYNLTNVDYSVELKHLENNFDTNEKGFIFKTLKWYIDYCKKSQEISKQWLHVVKQQLIINSSSNENQQLIVNHIKQNAQQTSLKNQSITKSMPKETSIQLLASFIDCTKSFLFEFQDLYALCDQLPSYEKVLIGCSIHLIRLLHLARHNCTNYFEFDEATFSRVKSFFPIFAQIQQYHKSIHDSLDALKLDNIEFSIYLAYCVYSNALNYVRLNPTYTKVQNDAVKNVQDQLAKRSIEIFGLLSSYMNLRRNESEPCEKLVALTYKINKINLSIQRSMYYRLSEAEVYENTEPFLVQPVQLNESLMKCQQFLYSPYKTRCV